MKQRYLKTPSTKTKQKKASGKARTPSGQILSNSVKDIRNFFLNEKAKLNVAIHDPSDKSIVSSESDTDSEQNQSTVEFKGNTRRLPKRLSKLTKALHHDEHPTVDKTQSCPNLLVLNEEECQTNQLLESGLTRININTKETEVSKGSYNQTMEFPQLLGGVNAIQTRIKDQEYIKRRLKN